MLISLDTETTGIDIAHGAMPFLVTTCDDSGVIRFWEWDVNPRTRKPNIPDEDLIEITELIDAADLIYMQNSKFDARALHSVGIDLPWSKVRDTLVMGHLLASNHRHDLTSMCIEFLGVDIERYELSVKEVTRACRTLVKKTNPDWVLAEEDLPGMPSVKGSSKRDEDKPWKNDMWLPRAVSCNHDDYDERCLTVASQYANADSEHTLYLGLEMERIIRERGFWNIYKHRLHLQRVACEMEMYGVTNIGDYTESTIDDYERYSAEAGAEMVSIASEYGHNLELADGASLNDNMRDFFYGARWQECPKCNYVKRIKHWNGETESDEPCPKCANRKKSPSVHKLLSFSQENLALPIIKGKKSGNASLDKDAMQEYLHTLDGDALAFIKILTDKRKHDTDLMYMQAYRRFWKPSGSHPGFYRIHPSLNPFGTDHLRWASSGPNLQNVGKQEDECEECRGEGCVLCNYTGKTRTSVRNCFGPLPDREWWSMDFKSIERRIPPYECGEPKMVEVFEKPNQPPYWGSLYYLTASVLYPDEFWSRTDHPDRFKKEKPKLYKQAKFFDLAKQYGAGSKKGDLLSKIKNSYSLVDNEFPLLAKLQQHYLSMAERTGYVETLPDRTVDPKRGYPVLASRTEDNRILSTTPFNYHVSGTACWCKNTALVRCIDQCAEWRKEGFDAHIALEIHDEILFDFPRGRTHETNLPRALILKGLMEQSGENLIPHIPTPVSVEYHTRTWAEGMGVE